MNIGEFFIQIGLAGEDAVKKLDSTMNSIKKTVLGLQVALIGAAVALERFTSGSINSATNVSDFNKQTGLAIEELNKWYAVGQKVNKGLTFDTIRTNVASLQEQLEQIRIGQGNIAPFQLLGLNINQNAFGVLNQLRENIKGLNNPQAVNLIKQLGLDSKFIDVLRLSDAEFKKLSNNNFLNGKQIAQVTTLGKAFNNLKLEFISFKDQAVAKLAPSLTKLLNDLNKWSLSNSKQIIETIANIASGFTKFITAITNAGRLIGEFTANLIGSKNALLGLGVFLGAVFGAFKPFYLLLFAIIAILDDIAVWKAGGDSAFGGFYETIDKLIQKFRELPDIVKILGGVGVAAFILQISSAFSALVGSVKLLQGALLLLLNNPIIRALGIATAAVGAGYALYNKYFGSESIAEEPNLNYTPIRNPFGLNSNTNNNSNSVVNNKFDMYINSDNGHEVSKIVINEIESSMFLENQLK